MRRVLAVLSASALLLAPAWPAAAARTPSTATGSVFVTNPVQSLGDESLTDGEDAHGAVPGAAYREVTLTNLDRGIL